ncbi:MAG TPA: UDP-N-acetylmuramoyl-tripeptide--D-alanyl-D-alanine ligase [Thermodesulfovibrionales bacterium]|nr:UDP-N-acetylmuramoyl-tripeptide--D-alanyl-D-alanine ligase [Thermodesulfovibrionales bacterium]
MAAVTLQEVLSATGGRVVYENADNRVFTGVSIDSRTIGAGELFVALKGQRFDGHDFLKDAMEKGRGAVVSDAPAVPVRRKTIIQVESTLKALQAIARSMRIRRRLAVVGITGTNGKTTTKELVASIMGKKHRVMRNAGNLNNQIGLPLSLTRGEENDEFAIMEMGASANGDIRELCEVALPDYGIITNIGPAHLEGFGSLEKVRETKLELFDAVRTIVLNADDLFLMEGVSRKAGGKKPEVITFGIERSADVFARDIVLESRRSVFTLCLAGGCSEVAIHINGRFNIYNAIAAAALCHRLGVGLEDIKAGLESFTGVPMRLELKQFSGSLVISDVYNANPASMEEAVRELIRLRKDRAVAVLGDMFELGEYADEAHRKLGRWMAGLPVDVFIAVGEMMAKAAEEFSAARKERSAFLRESGQVLTAPDSTSAGKLLSSLCQRGDTILLKGSRGMHMERALEQDNGTSSACLRENTPGPLRKTKNAL